MSDKSEAFLGGVLVGIVAVFLLLGIFVDGPVEYDRRAIEIGVAHYHPKTAKIVYTDSTTKYLLTGEK